MKIQQQIAPGVMEHATDLESSRPPLTDDNISFENRRSNAEWLWILWQHRSLLRRMTIQGLILVTVVAFLLPKRYESTTRVMPPDPESNSGMGMLAALAGKAGDSGSSSGLGGGLGMLAGDLLGAKSSGASLVGILKSDTIQDRLIDRFNLRKIYSVRYEQDARKGLSKFSNIEEDKKTGIISIQVTDRSPQRAAAMAKAYVDELDRLVAELSTSAARRERVFIEDRLKSVKQELDSSARQFSEYASQNTAVDIAAQTKAMVESAAVLQGQLIAAQSELHGLEQIYTASNIRVRTVQARVAELKHQLQNLGGDGSPLTAEITTPTDTKTPAAVSENEEMFPPIRKLPLLGVRWADLYRQNRINETVYELLRQKYELARIQEAKEIPTIKVLDPAAVPEKKTSPSRSLIILLGTLFAFAAGCFLVIGTVIWQETSPDDRGKQLAQEIGGKFRTSTASLYEGTLKRFRRKGNDHPGNNGNSPHSN